MEITVIRKEFPGFTEGIMTIEGHSFICNTLEDTNRDINKNGVFDGSEKKIPGETCIPYGRYRITLDVVSPKYSKVPTYNKIKGKVPRLLNVPDFEGILIHIGNTVKDTSGCILVGRKLWDGFITESTKTFFALYDIMKEANDRKEEIWITFK